MDVTRQQRNPAMNHLADQFAAFIVDFKAQRGWNKSLALRLVPERPGLTEEQREKIWNEIEMLQADFDPDYEYAADHNTYEKGKRTADRIRFQLSLLGYA